jgi:hypothetical protein
VLLVVFALIGVLIITVNQLLCIESRTLLMEVILGAFGIGGNMSLLPTVVAFHFSVLHNIGGSTPAGLII